MIMQEVESAKIFLTWKKNTQKGQYSIHLVSLTLVLNSSYSLWSDMLKSQARSKGGKKEPFKKLLHKY